MTGEKPKLRKREILLALGAGALAAGTIAIAVDDDDESYDYVVGIESGEDMDEVIEVSYAVSNFDQLSASGPFDIVITQGDEFAVRGEGPRWVLDQMEASVSHNRLIIEPISNDMSGAWDDSSNVTFHITMPALSWLSVSGAGDVAIDRITGESFESEINGAGELSIGSIDVEDVTFGISGAGSVEASGTADNTRIAITGAGGVDAEQLRSRTASITITGAGGVDLTVDDEADINVTGGAEVNVYGSASCTINQTGFVDVNCEGAEPDSPDSEIGDADRAEPDAALAES